MAMSRAKFLASRSVTFSGLTNILISRPACRAYDFFNARERIGDGLKVAQALKIVFNAIAARPPGVRPKWRPRLAQ